MRSIFLATISRHAYILVFSSITPLLFRVASTFSHIPPYHTATILLHVCSSLFNHGKKKEKKINILFEARHGFRVDRRESDWLIDDWSTAFTNRPLLPIDLVYRASSDHVDSERTCRCFATKVYLLRESVGRWSGKPEYRRYVRKRNLDGKTWAGSASWRPWKRSRRAAVDDDAARSSRKSWSFRRATGHNRTSYPPGMRRYPSRRPRHFCHPVTKRAFQVSSLSFSLSLPRCACPE